MRLPTLQAMPARARSAGLSAAVSDAGRHLSQIARLEVELARAETTRKARSFGAAATLVAVAAVCMNETGSSEVSR